MISKKLRKNDVYDQAHQDAPVKRAALRMLESWASPMESRNTLIDPETLSRKLVMLACSFLG